jgi:ribosome modulation factor
MSEDMSLSDDEQAQNAFDDQLERIRLEGQTAFANSIPRNASPYKTHPQRHFHHSWAGGWAEANLQMLEERWAGSQGRRAIKRLMKA